MRFVLLIALTGALAGANTLVNSNFGQPQTNCNYTSDSPYTTPTCPVIGDPARFDIQSITVSFSGSSLVATIDFNYGGTQSLLPYQDATLNLQPGDLFFYDPSDPTQKKQFGVALGSERPGSQFSFMAGDLFKIGGDISVETAQTALNNPGVFYRKSEQVLMVDNTSNPVADAIGSGVQVAIVGDSLTSAKYEVTVKFDAPADFLAIFQSGLIGVDFAAADCGNAVLSGPVYAGSPTPEPGAAALMGFGVCLIGLTGYWRKKSARK